MKLSTGINLLAEVDEQVSEVEAPGYHIRHMVKRQDATRVAIAGIQGFVAHGFNKIQGHSKDLETTTDGAVALGAQKTSVAKAQIAVDGATKAKELDNQAILFKK